MLLKLKEYMKEYAGKPMAVAFSGGVDSVLVLKAALLAAGETKQPVHAICIQSALTPGKESEEAEETATKLGAFFHKLSIDEFEGAGILDNPPDRCYLCKRYLFQQVKALAAENGAEVVFDGTNADDLTVYRPGKRALKELQIKSPLAELGITKAQVRKTLEEEGISVFSKPSAPCLATRFPYGTHLTREKLATVEQAEEYIKTFVTGNVRVRVHEDIARIEVDEDRQGILVVHSREITEKLRELGYEYVTMDLAGFESGSMDRKIDK